MAEILRILALLALVAGNAFFVIGEYAIVTARRSALRARADAGSAGARAALRLMDDPVQVLSTVQVGITAIGILSGALSAPLAGELFGDAIPDWLGFLIGFILVTFLSVVLGELVPKALTLDRAETLAALVARPIALISTAFRPVVRVLQASALIVLRPLGIREVVVGDAVKSPEELRALVEEAEENGVIPHAQEELLHRVFDFAGREAGDVMVPAPEVVWLDAGLTVDEALERLREAPHTRYPVGQGSLDRVTGVIHARELVVAARADGDAPIGPRAQPAPIVPATKDLGALLRELRERRQSLAVVVGEYGTTAGIVTLEDIAEEIFGEIDDEYTLPDDTLAWEDDHTVLVAGSMTIDDFNEMVGTHLAQDGARSMAGLVFSALGRRPDPGDTVTLGSVRLSVDEIDRLRIKRLRVKLTPGPSPS